MWYHSASSIKPVPPISGHNQRLILKTKTRPSFDTRLVLLCIIVALVLAAICAKGADAPPPVFKAPPQTNAPAAPIHDDQKLWNNGQAAPSGLWPGQHPVEAEWYVAPAQDTYSAPQANSYPAQNFCRGSYAGQACSQSGYSSITSYGSDPYSRSAGFSHQGVFSRPTTFSGGCFNQYQRDSYCAPVTDAGFNTRISLGGSIGSRRGRR